MRNRRWVLRWVTQMSLALFFTGAPGPPLAAQTPPAAPPVLHAPQPFVAVGTEPAPSRSLLDRPLESPPDPTAHFAPPPSEYLWQTAADPPLGFTGRSGVLPGEVQQGSHFVPAEDRWRVGFPEWDRYLTPPRFGEDAPYEKGHWWDPYNQNVLKGDYPVWGQHTFLDLTASSFMIAEPRQLPTPANAFDSTAEPGRFNAFGDPDQFLYSHYFSLSLDLFHGDAAFKPVDWRVKLTPIFNVNFLDIEEVGVVLPNVLGGTQRGRSWFALEEWFVETKLADLSPDYDFLSIRGGSQPFNNDFRGFLFNDVNRGVRLFGTRLANRDQVNAAAFFQLDKDINSFLNTFEDRHQTVVLGNYYRQDFIWPGYTAQVSFVYNNDRPTFKFDNNGFLARPDPVGTFTPHELDIFYLGWAGDGHIGRFNITHQFYWALGHDSFNNLANQEVDVNAQMFALELSYDRDWIRFRTQFFWASGDDDINNSHATGFDTILDAPNFIGGEFSYWNRQAIPLLGVNLVQRNSLVPDLRSSKFQGQSNFVNPGIVIVGVGADFELTPKLRLITNYNYLWFESTEVLEQFVFQEGIDSAIGADLSWGVEYRPLLSNNIIMLLGVSTLIPGTGFRDLYNNLGEDVDPLAAGFMQLTLTY